MTEEFMLKGRLEIWFKSKQGLDCKATLWGGDDDELLQRSSKLLERLAASKVAQPQDNAPRPEPGATITYKDSDGSERCNALTQDGTACGAKGRWKPNQYGEGEFWACPKYKSHVD